MDFFTGSGSRKFISFRLGKEMSGQPSQDAAEIMEIDVPPTTQELEPAVTEVPADKRSLVELSSNTDTESCEAYISRTVELLANVEPVTLDPNNELPLGAKVSVSEPVAMTPGLNELIPEEEELPEDVPRVVFLDKATDQVAVTGASPKEQNMLIDPMPSETLVPNSASQQEKVEGGAAGSSEQGEREVNRGNMDYRSQTDDESCYGMETDTGSLARSTLAQALYCPGETRDVARPSDSSNESVPPEVRAEAGPSPLSATSRVIIKQCFTETNPICLDPGHPVVAFNQEQITSIIRIVADESARASFEMLNSVVQPASRLNLGSPTKTASQRQPHSISGIDTDTDVGSESVVTQGTRRGGSSTGATSDAESHHDFQSSIALPTPPAVVSVGLTDLGSNSNSPTGSSPGTQTLANVRREAINEQRQAGKRGTTRTRTGGQMRPRRRVGRVMKEDCFESMPWTRTFVSGPVDPKWNKHKIYCQICKCNVSIRAKGPKEILRHYATERHLRKDQRWRYEHLTIEDPLNKRLRYQVRGRDGKVLSNYQLQLELPHFIESELVDIGDKQPFYDDAMAGSDYMASSPQNRAKMQITILGNFLPLSGDIRVLRMLWQQVGTVVNHRTIFSDIDWSTARLSVSNPSTHFKSVRGLCLLLGYHCVVTCNRYCGSIVPFYYGLY